MFFKNFEGGQDLFSNLKNVYCLVESLYLVGTIYSISNQ